MNDPRRKQNTKAPKFNHLDMDTTNAASSMDFTGLIPANPKTDEEAESYKNIHEFGREAAKDIANQ